MNKRNMVNKAATICCKWCNAEISAYALPSHLKFSHKDKTIDDYVNEFGEFRKSKLNANKERTRKTNKVVCEICNREFSSVGMSNHLRDSHEMTTEQYLAAGYVEFRPKYIDYSVRAETNDIKCLVCNADNFASHQHFSHHVSIEHELSMIEYAQKYIFKDEKQLCLCGCNEPVALSPRPPYRVNYISGHNENPMTGKRHKQESKEKMREKSIERGLSNVKLSDTKPELEFKAFLNKNGIRFSPQHPTPAGIVDFYLPDLNMYVEIDGTYWHPTKIEFLNIQLINSCISQHNKRYVDNLYRIRENDIKNINCIDDIKRLNFIYNYDITLNQTIIAKEYFKEHSSDNKISFVPILLKFIRTYSPKFPTITTTETISEVVDKIKNYDLTKIQDGNVFSNNISVIGVSLLKSNFKSYWKSSYKGKKSPVAAWEDDNVMHDIIKYRIGINKSEETFDFSFHQMVTGISVNRYTVSFFKPLLAAAIYKHFLNDKQYPVVFDPCCGFGGRLLAFKSLYPDGTYIGCEPNIETYNELQELAKNFSNVEIHNCKVEDFNLSRDIDLSFTSIPYYDLETYSNVVEYKSIAEWRDTFLTKIKSLPNLVLNIPNTLRADFDDNVEELFIKSNTSHFDKKTTTKTEYLLNFLK